MNANTTNDSLQNLASIVDLERYPIHDLEHGATKQAIQACRERLDDDGCALIKTSFVMNHSNVCRRSQSACIRRLIGQNPAIRLISVKMTHPSRQIIPNVFPAAQ